MINTQQYLMLKEILKENMEEDEHGKSNICNIYFDTEQYELIRHSTSKLIFKDKVRLRSYNIPNQESTVFLEIKRKYKGVVSKRRITMQLSDFYKYINKETYAIPETQVRKELTYIVNVNTEKSEKEFIDEIRCRNGNLLVMLERQEMSEVEL